MNKEKINVLILDDEENILTSLKRLLSTENYNVVTKSKPEEAIDYVRNNVVHIALLDVLMPNMDGITVLNIIKEISGLTQVIMMSAYSTTDRIISALENGANDFILKPFESLDALVKIIDTSADKLDRWKKVLKECGAI